MSSSTLVLDYVGIATEVGHELGYGRDTIVDPPTACSIWDTGQQLNVIQCIKRGCRQFYKPPAMVIPGTNFRKAHRWRFLRPIASLNAWATDGATTIGTPSTTITFLTSSLAVYDPEMIGKSVVFTVSGNSYTITAVSAGATNSTITVSSTAVAEGSAKAFTITANGDYRLPDNIGGVDGQLFMATGTGWRPLESRDLSEVLSMRQELSITGVPRMFANQPRTSDGSADQFWSISLYPTPSETFVMSYRGIRLPNALTTASPYPFGGAEHSGTILASCLAMAEMVRFGQHGPRWDEFMTELESSIGMDNANFAPQTIGQPWGKPAWPYPHPFGNFTIASP